MADAALLAEAYKRGLLPAEKAAAYEEGVKRGIVKDAYAEGRLMGRDPKMGAAATFDEAVPLLDEFKAGVNSVIDTAQGRGSLAENWKTRRTQQVGIQDQYAKDHPNMAGVMTNSGYAVQAVPAFLSGGATAAPGIVEAVEPAAKSLLQRGGRMLMTGARNATAGASIGAANAAAGRGDLAERTADAAKGAVAGAVVNTAAPAVLGMRRKPGAVSMTRKADTEVLKDMGVQTSIPQRMGGMAKQTEDLAMRAPILGPAISGARARQVEQLNRGWALRALEPVGKTVPAEIKPGFEMVEHVDDELGKVYGQAAKMTPRVQLDEQMVRDAERIAARRGDLADSDAAQFDRIVADRMNRLRSGEASGDMVKTIHGELGALQAEAARQGKDTLAAMLGDTRRAMMGLIERANPEAAKLIGKADQGWRIYSQMNDAAAKASNRGGVFLPGQINTEVRADARAQGSNMAGKGKGAMQREATAAARMIPDTFGNPGTANAVGLGGMGVGLMTAPVKTVAVAGGLTAASTPYWLMARRVLEQLPERAGRAEIAAADAELAKLAAKDPKVAGLREELAARLNLAVTVPMSQDSRR